MPIWRLPAVKAEFGWRSDASAYNSIRAGLLTAGVAIGQRSRGWPDFEVNVNVSDVCSRNSELNRLVEALRVAVGR